MGTKGKTEPAPAVPDDFAVMVPIDSLHEDLANANVHDDADITGIMAKLATFGQVEPLVVQKSTRKVIGGNGRLHAMRRLGWTECRVHLADCDNVTATAMGISLNHRDSHFDDATLAKHLRSLQSEGFNLTATGFDDADVDRMCERLGDDLAAEEPPPQDSPPVGQFAVIVACRDEADQEETYNRLSGLGLECKVVCV